MKYYDFPWSFSSLDLFTCPKKYELLRAKKIVKGEPSKAGDEGARLHEVIEKYIRDDIWNEELAPWKKVLDIYKAKEGVCEAEYAFKFERKFEDSDLIMCSGKDEDRFYLGFIDWMKITGDKCEIVDWKTGRVKLTKQLQLYAWVVMLAHPEVNEVKVTFHWLNQKDQISDTFYRKDMDKLFQPFKDILDEIDNCYRTDVWFEIPGTLVKKTGRGSNCSYCPVTIEHCSNGKPKIEEF